MAPGNASDSFGTRDRLTVDDTAYLDLPVGSSRWLAPLPYSLNVVSRRESASWDDSYPELRPALKCIGALIS